jgi:hypothetical protein
MGFAESYFETRSIGERSTIFIFVFFVSFVVSVFLVHS